LESGKARNILENYLSSKLVDITSAEITKALGALRVWADYHRLDMCKIWTNLTECLETDKPALPNSHEGIDLQLYSQGLFYRNIGMKSMYPREFLKSIVAGKVVADVGCGAGSWSLYFKRWLGVAEVYAIDRPEIIEHFLDDVPIGEDSQIHVIPKAFEDVTQEDFQTPPEVFFFSEVIHGKTRQENISLFEKMPSLTSHRRFHVIINELDLQSNPFFELQMRLHTKGGGVYWPGELNNLLGGIGEILSW
jgi:hypothetical protein